MTSETESGTRTCEWCEGRYPADAETIALQDVGSWKADYCPECRELHFVCEECGTVTHVADRHKKHAWCGDTRAEGAGAGALEVAIGDLQELADALIGAGDLAAIR